MVNGLTSTMPFQPLYHRGFLFVLGICAGWRLRDKSHKELIRRGLCLSLQVWSFSSIPEARSEVYLKHHMQNPLCCGQIISFIRHLQLQHIMAEGGVACCHGYSYFAISPYFLPYHPSLKSSSWLLFQSGVHLFSGRSDRCAAVDLFVSLRFLHVFYMYTRARSGNKNFFIFTQPIFLSLQDLSKFV